MSLLKLSVSVSEFVIINFGVIPLILFFIIALETALSRLG